MTDKINSPDSIEMRNIDADPNVGALWYHNEKRYTVTLDIAVPSEMNGDELLEELGLKDTKPKDTKTEINCWLKDK